MKLYLSDLLFALSGALDCVEKELVGTTTNHSRRVALLCLRLCQHLGLRREDVFDMVSCGVLHDNALTEYTLQQGRTKVQRLENVEIHCSSGESNAAHFPFYGDARNIILHHHENWDGSGFFGCTGKEIRVRAATLRLADSLDLALPLGTGRAELIEKAHAHVHTNCGTIYSPEVSVAFLEIFDESLVQALSNEHIGAVLEEFSATTRQELELDELERVCRIFACITDAKSPFTATHCHGVAQKARLVAEHLQLSPEHVQRIIIAAHLHDIGKLSIPHEILEKPGALSAEEFTIMKSHVQMTETLLQGVRGLEEIARWAASHHEKVCGGGYPHGIDGESLSMESRLLACVDVYQALVEDRPYRAGMSHAKALAILQRMALGGALDSTLVEQLDAALLPLAHTLPSSERATHLCA